MHINKQMNDFVIGLLKSKIPSTYYYHNYTHSLYVQEKAVEIGKHEKCSKKELELLHVAALWHDVGYINTYKDHEEESCTLARKYLPDYNYLAEEINLICGMIMATRVPQMPTNKLEEIIADADMEYLGTEKAAEWANDLFKELSVLDPKLTKKDWNKIEIKFLRSHHFFTLYCKENKEHIKQAYLRSLIY